MESSQKRSGAQDWIQFLCSKPLPVKSQTIQRIKSSLAEPRVSLHDLAKVATTDPAFCAHLVSKANALNHNADTEANTAELATSILGMDHFLALMNSVPIIKLNPSSVPHRWYFRSLETSLHAMAQAADICRFPGKKVQSDTAIAGLFYGIGHWALWRYAPLEMSAIKHETYVQHKDSALAEYDVLGCTIQEISAGLVEHWNLSSLAILALHHDTSPDNNALDLLHEYAISANNLSDAQQLDIRRLLNSNFFPVKLANWLALTCQDGWESEKAHKLQQIVADFVKATPEEGRARILNTCAATSRNSYTPGILMPAAQLLLIPSDQHLPYQMSVDGQASSKAGKSKSANEVKPQSQRYQGVGVPVHIVKDEFKDKALFQQLYQKMLQADTDANGEKQLLTHLLQAVREGLGLSRVCLFKVEQGSSLRTLAAQGFVEKDPIYRYTQQLNVPSLFKKLAKRPAAITMTKTNRAQIFVQLPDRFKHCCHQNSFVLISVFYDNQPYLLVYADHNQVKQDISPFFTKYFKLICNALSKKLNQPSTTDK